jgi:TBC1 domain family protein 5
VLIDRFKQAYDEAVAATRATSNSLTALDPNKFNPLSKAVGNPWAQAHKDTEQMEEIWKDVERTFPEREFFQSVDTQKALQRVLFTWGKKNAKAYKQGLNEIAAIVFEAVRTPVAADLEAIAFHIFERIMSNESVSGMFYGSSSSDENYTAKRCDNIFKILIKRELPEIHKHLASIVEVSASLFLLRWTRLLFAREFHIEDVIKLWDIIFADIQVTGKSDLSDFIALAMVQFVGKDLLRLDNCGCLRRLLKFPPVSDVTIITKQAIFFRDGIVISLPPSGQQETQPAQAAQSARVELSRGSSSNLLDHDVWEDVKHSDAFPSLHEVIDSLSKSNVAEAIQTQIEQLRRIATDLMPNRK